MPVTYVNRHETTYYLHVGKTRKGNPRYWFSKSPEGDLVDALPEGYEVYENPDCQVFLRKIVPQKVTPFEVATVTKGLERYAPGEKCLVDVQGEHIVVYHAEKSKLDLPASAFVRSEPIFFGRYMKVMQFILDDEGERTFRVQRWCFRGSIDDWIDLWSSGGIGHLPDLVKKYCPHIGKESFFELM
ncbi:MAG: hypothetical protein U0790_26990 [Isosphaeraceae bacterium]